MPPLAGKKRLEYLSPRQIFRKARRALIAKLAVVRPATWAMAASLVSASGAILALVVLVPDRSLPAHLSILFLAVAISACAAAFSWWYVARRKGRWAWYRRWRAERRRLRAERHRLAAERADWTASLEQWTAQITSREKQLINRLTTFHEWMEFPQPISLTEAENDVASWIQKDRQLVELLQRQTEAFFQKVLANAYLENNQLQWARIRDDAIGLIRQVARLYRPEVDEPLLEVSVEQILRSASRVCLQMLIVLDRLPLDVKQYNLNRLYGYIRSAVKAYGIYKAAEPYLPYVSSAYYLGRAAMGANPWLLSAWWLVGRQSQRWVKQWAGRFVERQALALLRDVVHLIGYEAAAVYGGDFYHRDANWIYGVELVELMRSVPLAPDSFRAALNELGRLPLRSEYDRVFLYRAVAVRQSADPDRYRPRELLTPQERQSIGRRLENFAHAFWVHGDLSQWTRWAQRAEERLGVRFSFPCQEPLPPEEQRIEAVRSLASYLLDRKECELSAIETWLTNTQCWKRLSTEQQAAMREELLQNPPYVFLLPMLEVRGPEVEHYWADLVELAVAVPPHLFDLDDLLAETAAYLHRETSAVRYRFDQALRRRLETILATPDALRCDPPSGVVRAVLELTADRPGVEFLYPCVIRESSAMAQAVLESRFGRSAWLLGTEQRLIVFSVSPQGSRMLWTSDTPINLRQYESWIGSRYLLDGGQWIDPADVGRSIWVPAPLWKSRADYWRPLLSSALVRQTES